MVVYAFDVGETLIDESRIWLRYAHHVGVPPLTFIGVLGAFIAEGRELRDVFAHFGVDLDRFESNLAWRDRPDDGLKLDDFYPDALPTLKALTEAGNRVIVAGNQSKRFNSNLEAMDLPVASIRYAHQWGAQKPTRRFFRRLIREAGVDASEIVYVGDRVDHDVLPALDTGMRAILIRRGPWGHVHSAWPDAARADAVIGSLRALL